VVVTMPRDSSRPSTLPRAVIDPAHPERTCWGCDKYCPAADLACGNGSIRTPHPKELFGPGWKPVDEAWPDHSAGH
jgi:hypothetical protein